jgi:adenylate kinase family enzyme
MVGNSGSGKTTLGRALAEVLGAPFTELDAIHHQPGWRPIEVPEFRERVAGVVAAESWVVDGNYSAVIDLVFARADTVVWFDLPRRTVMRQVLYRTVTRAVTRTELWNGNREPLTGLFRIDPHQSILRWAWTQHAKYRARYSAAAADPLNAHLTFVRVGSRAEARRLLTAVTAPD